MPLSDLDAALEAVVPLVRRAGDEILRIEREGITRERKADHTIVTNADRAADRILRDGLRAAFPSVPVLTEESGLAGCPAGGRVAGAGIFFVVDPLDGTRAFARGEAGFAVMVGLVEAGAPVLGVVLDPRSGDLFVAARGRGAWRERGGARERLAPRARSGPPRLVVTSSMPEGEGRRLAEALGAGPPHRVHSVGVKIALLATGAYDVYVNTHPVSVWDIAAPAAILAEAGGTYTDLDGRPVVLRAETAKAASGTLATVGRDHMAVLAAVRAAL